jgi:exopolysaccharide production protein ExoY
MKKRLFDILFSALALCVSAPLLLLLMLLIKTTSKGPIFFPGTRMGYRGKLFSCWKFRTMHLDADKQLEPLLKEKPDLLEEWKTYHKLKNDPRLTRVGGWMRKLSLDELPQFWNVIKGELSIVGPRPIEIQQKERALEEFQMHYGDRAKKILSVKPGIFSLWQIRGRNLLTFEERAALEEEYIDCQSLAFDIKIILKTIPILLKTKGAY